MPAGTLAAAIRSVSGAQAAALGIVQWSAPAAELAGRARALAAEIAALPAHAIAQAKRCITAAVIGEVDGYEMELSATASLLEQGETQGLVQRFLDKRR